MREIEGLYLLIHSRYFLWSGIIIKMKKTPLKRKTPLRSKKVPKRPKKRSKRKTGTNKTKSKGYQCPKWFMRIKVGSHGNTPAQKRLWKLVSDTYREEDAKLYGNCCPLCGKYLNHWKDGQLGHWLAWSVCNSWFKYERRNLMMICSGCNIYPSSITLRRMGEVLQERWGEDILDWIEQENQRYRGQKLEQWMLVDYAKMVNPAIAEEE